MLGIKYAVFILKQQLEGISRKRTLMSRENKILPHLTSCIDDICCEFLALVLDDFAESIFNRGIVALHEMSVDKLDRQGGFACDVIISTCKI